MQPKQAATRSTLCTAGSACTAACTPTIAVSPSALRLTESRSAHRPAHQVASTIAVRFASTAPLSGLSLSGCRLLLACSFAAIALPNGISAHRTASTEVINVAAFPRLNGPSGHRPSGRVQDCKHASHATAHRSAQRLSNGLASYQPAQPASRPSLDPSYPRPACPSNGLDGSSKFSWSASRSSLCSMARQAIDHNKRLREHHSAQRPAHCPPTIAISLVTPS